MNITYNNIKILIVLKKTLAGILAGVFLFTSVLGWAQEERLFFAGTENIAFSSRPADNHRLATVLRTTRTDFRELYKAAAICRSIEQNGNLDDRSYLNDVLARLDADKNTNITILPYEIIVEIPNEGLAVRYFDPTKANVITPYSDVSKLSTKIIGPRLNRQIIYRIKALSVDIRESRFTETDRLHMAGPVKFVKEKFRSNELEQAGFKDIAIIDEEKHTTRTDNIKLPQSIIPVASNKPLPIASNTISRIVKLSVIPTISITLSYLLGGFYVSLFVSSFWKALLATTVIGGITLGSGSYMEQTARGEPINWNKILRWGTVGAVLLGPVTYGVWFPLLNYLTTSPLLFALLDLCVFAPIVFIPLEFLAQKYWVSKDEPTPGFINTIKSHVLISTLNILWFGPILYFGRTFWPDWIVLIDANAGIIWAGFAVYLLESWKRLADRSPDEIKVVTLENNESPPASPEPKLTLGVDFGADTAAATAVDMLLPQLKKYRFPASEIGLQIPPRYQRSSLSLEDVITAQPPNDRYIYPDMAGHEQDYERIRELHLLIADAGFVAGRPGLREAVNEVIRRYPEARAEIEKIMQDTQLNNKGKKVNIINLLYVQAGIPLVPYSLLQHARDEWNIVTSLINGNADFQKAIISQSLKAQDVLNRTEKFFGDELRLLKDDKTALNFLAHFLLLHDLGKFVLSEEDHERRSEAILDIIFRDNYFNFSPFEKKLLKCMVGLHSAIEKINSSPDIEQEFKELAKEASRDGFFTETELLNIVRIMIIFRIAELVESGHFAFIHESTFPDLVNVYKTTRKIILNAYDSNDILLGVKELQRHVSKGDTPPKDVFPNEPSPGPTLKNPRQVEFIDSLPSRGLDIRVIFGVGSLNQLGEVSSRYGKSALLVTGRSALKTGLSGRCVKLLEDANIRIGEYHEVTADPTVEQVNQIAGLAKSGKFELIVAVGGGSVIDAAKAASALVLQGGRAEEYFTDQREAGPDLLPVVAVPTTAGTGSELSTSAIISWPERFLKGGIRGALSAKAAVVDPALTLTMSPEQTRITGFDVFAHAVETYISKKASPEIDKLSEEAIIAVCRFLPRVLKNPQDLEARTYLSFYSMAMGYNLVKSSTCLPHRLQYPVGALTGTPHALGLAALYPAWIKTTYESSRERFDNVAKWIAEGMGVQNNGISNSLYRFMDAIDLKPTLRDLKIDEEMCVKMAGMVSGSLGNDPWWDKGKNLSDLYLQALEPMKVLTGDVPNRDTPPKDVFPNEPSPAPTALSPTSEGLPVQGDLIASVETVWAAYDRVKNAFMENNAEDYKEGMIKFKEALIIAAPYVEGIKKGHTLDENYQYCKLITADPRCHISAKQFLDSLLIIQLWTIDYDFDEEQQRINHEECRRVMEVLLQPDEDRLQADTNGLLRIVKPLHLSAILPPEIPRSPMTHMNMASIFSGFPNILGIYTMDMIHISPRQAPASYRQTLAQELIHNEQWRGQHITSMVKTRLPLECIGALYERLRFSELGEDIAKSLAETSPSWLIMKRQHAFEEGLRIGRDERLMGQRIAALLKVGGYAVLSNKNLHAKDRWDEEASGEALAGIILGICKDNKELAWEFFRKIFLDGLDVDEAEKRLLGDMSNRDVPKRDTPPKDVALNEPSQLLQNQIEYIDKDKTLFEDILGENKPDTLVRVPIEAIEPVGVDNIKDFLATFQEAPNGYVELYYMSGIGEVTESVYQKYDLQKKPLPKGFRRTRENTVTLFPAFKGEEVNQAAILSRLGNFDITPEDTILSPIGLQHDPVGLIRATILGLKIMNMARKIKAKGIDITKDQAFKDEIQLEILEELKNVCDADDLKNFNLTPDDIISIATGTINNIITALKKLIKLLPITPIDAEELRRIYEHAKAVLVAA